ncbi:hypothetical protein L7F22_015786 [Adiantum nelumboides]|nr:hypothetical protein [Adiantum nelumboides]
MSEGATRRLASAGARGARNAVVPTPEHRVAPPKVHIAAIQSKVLAILDRLRTEREERAGKGDMDDAEDDDNWEDIEEDQKPLATSSKEMDDDELEKGSG